jgi:LPPG:FO 2-phospho-L-lactate transferase
MEALSRYETVRPAGSAAATTWFNLGDQDLATHMYRTTRRAEGATLSEITAEIARAWRIAVRLVPMSDDPVATRLVLPDGSELAFQDYFVRHHHDVEVAAVRFAHDGARPTAAAVDAIDDADVLVVAPSNPIVSIGPLRALPGIDAQLTARRERNVAVSPIVGGRALKGPADRMLVELGHEATVVGVARLYRDIAATLVIDPADADLSDGVLAAGMRPVVVDSIMSTPARAAALAEATIAAIG